MVGAFLALPTIVMFPSAITGCSESATPEFLYFRCMILSDAAVYLFNLITHCLVPMLMTHQRLIERSNRTRNWSAFRHWNLFLSFMMARSHSSTASANSWGMA